MKMNRIGVFCGSSMGLKDEYRAVARLLAELLLKRDLELIYGGANVGLMKILADTMLNGGGTVIGVMPKSLIEKEVAHPEITRMHTVDSMQERKVLMADLSDAFIALPGGYGTLDELAEMLTYNQLRIHDKPLGILNTIGYFDFLLRYLDNGVVEGFIREEHRRNIIVDENPDRLLTKLKGYKPVEMDKWIREIKTESSGH